MKKYLVLLICLFIVGCGKDYKTYTEKEKRKMYDIAYDEERAGNKEKMLEIDKLREKLKIEAEKGDSIAEKEYEEWKYIEGSTYRKTYSGKAKADLLNRLW